jgi:putative hydrolase of the HAD superfamily
MPIRAVVFDLFDTLVDLLSESVPLVEHDGRKIPRFLRNLHGLIAERSPIEFGDYLSAMQEVDRAFRQTHYEQGRELPSSLRFRRLVERLEIDDAGLSDRLVEAHMAGLSDQVRLLDHHPAVLSELRRTVRIGICSNFSHSPTAQRVLERAQLAPHLDATVISDAVGIRKPRAEIFEAALQCLEVSPAETIHVGDSLTADVAGAAALGIRTVWITRRVREPERALAAHEGQQPDWQIHDLAELPALLRGLGDAR